MPKEVKGIGELVHSDWLVNTSRVINNRVTCDYHIAEFINAYQVVKWKTLRKLQHYL